MLTMTDIHTIKNLRKNHDKSINHIRKELGANWRTAKKYADLQPKLRKKPGMIYDEPQGERVALWLSEDMVIFLSSEMMGYYETTRDFDYGYLVGKLINILADDYETE